MHNYYYVRSGKYWIPREFVNWERAICSTSLEVAKSKSKLLEWAKDLTANIGFSLIKISLSEDTLKKCKKRIESIVLKEDAEFKIHEILFFDDISEFESWARENVFDFADIYNN